MYVVKFLLLIKEQCNELQPITVTVGICIFSKQLNEMAGGSRSSRRSHASIKYWRVPLQVASDRLDIGQERDVPQVSGTPKVNGKEFDPKAPEILSTARIGTAIGQAWSYASHPPLRVFQARESGKTDGEKKDSECYFNEERHNNYIFVDIKSVNQQKVSSSDERAEVAEKFSLSSSSSSILLNPGNSEVPAGPYKAIGLGTAGIMYNLPYIYGWQRGKPYLCLKDAVNLTQNELKKPDYLIYLAKYEDLHLKKTIDLVGGVLPLEKTSDSVADRDIPSNKILESVKHAIRPLTDTKIRAIPSTIATSSICLECNIDYLDERASGESQCAQEDDEKSSSKQRKVSDLLLGDENKARSILMITAKENHVFSNNRHAFAGALAGTFVSLSLHPFDTIKTLLQSHNMSETHKPLFHIVRSILSERGVIGLYRGVSSNIALSAPISAVYTFTYESVKRVLLPYLPKDYNSIAHCTAGGCASIATSFIFTPSERIKQQMQVNSHYQNCWTASISILRNGGLVSLYAGWGAVLCRNIPHSIIKFYTYERLKQLLSSSNQPESHFSTFHTLLCGGLAGSTAALFTTPFDVVKTRLQTEVPGSLSKYAGVWHALQEISKHEGLKGLYRGLAPRLVMYISQGAIFFATYEFFKNIFCLEIPQLCTQTVQSKPNLKEMPTS